MQLDVPVAPTKPVEQTHCVDVPSHSAFVIPVHIFALAPAQLSPIATANRCNDEIQLNIK